ncbi:outer membrane beta-barrel protein [Arenibacter sp. GZD96]|uniref:outer membrane beta-barrel protein n=1 Tax=Aurantibrevibacter litoralis TaxID=3106030 RepID=UPI002AFE3DFA|nr:outer membrane beta-barrel protein [Arenibacter sp. GZD-96]MEA1786670.1 outer membrane beta-barrel protein [Arenibacter sp. GZD-96]
MNKKSIDDLFREKLKDYEDVPDEKVWQAIAVSLDKRKKSRKIIPIWWQLGGVAAALLLGWFLWNPLENTQKPAENTITNQEDTKEKTLERLKEAEEKPFELPHAATDAVVDTKAPAAQTEDEEASSNRTQKMATPLPKAKTSEITSNKAVERERPAVASLTTTPTTEDNAAVGNPSATMNLKATENNTAVAQEDGIQSETNQTKQRLEEARLQPEGRSTNAVAAAEAEEKGVQPPKKSIFEEIEQQQKEKEEALAKNRSDKWSVGPSVAPVFFSATGEGSPIHSNFATNSKTGKTNLSYGVVVSYELSKKVVVRSGIHKVDYSYNTNDVSFTAVMDPSTNALIDNINYALASRNISISSKTAAPNGLSTQANADVVGVNALETSRNASMEQQFGYVEVPLELTYALVDRKFGLHVIGGVSSLFLTNNAISLESTEIQTEVGEANNLNNVNFSTNFGIGMQYKFTPQLRVNVEPIFKYQLNTFSETAGSFNPFSIGVYSGINYRF